MSVMKQCIVKILRFLMTPWRKAKAARYATSEMTLGRKELPNETFLPVVSKAIADGNAAVILVKGYSMRPFLEHLRDSVELSPWTDIHVGDAVLAEIAPGHYVLHRVVRREGDELTLHGDGNLRGTEHCTMNDVRGVVSKYIAPAGHVTLATDAKLIRRIRRWYRMPLCMRRLYLIIYKQTI